MPMTTEEVREMADVMVKRLAASDRGRKSLVHLQAFLADCGIGLDPKNWIAVESIIHAAQIVPGTVLDLLSPYRRDDQ